MASIVDTSVKYFQSNLANAPVLNFNPGTLIGVLDAVLVYGYGLQTATSVVVADGVATCTFPSQFPALVDQVVIVTGATPTVLNGEQKITSVDNKIIRFATTAGNGAATGTITVKIAPAGWVKAFSGTNKAAYRIVDPQANGGGMYLRVDDSAPRYARVVGYEKMTDIDTGSGIFPSSVQTIGGGGGYWPRSEVDNPANAGGWFIAADSRFMLISVQSFRQNSDAYVGSVTRCFGDLIPRRPSGDAFAVGLNFMYDPAYPNHGALDCSRQHPRTALPRSYTGLGQSQVLNVYPFNGTSAEGLASGKDTSAYGAFPNPITGELLLSKSFVSEQGYIRANVPGIYTVPQSGVGGSFPAFSRIAGTGDLTGRNLVAVNSTENQNTTNNFGASFIDVTGPWR